MAWPIHAFAISAKERGMKQIVGCAVRTTIGYELSVRTAHPTLEAMCP